MAYAKSPGRCLNWCLFVFIFFWGFRFFLLLFMYFKSKYFRRGRFITCCTRSSAAIAETADRSKLFPPRLHWATHRNFWTCVVKPKFWRACKKGLGWEREIERERNRLKKLKINSTVVVRSTVSTSRTASRLPGSAFVEGRCIIYYTSVSLFLNYYAGRYCQLVRRRYI